jgi:hypothetical protein
MPNAADARGHPHVSALQTEAFYLLTRLGITPAPIPNIHDDKYDATVLGWAEFCGQPQVAQLVRERGGRA